jgi:hypothetical protein
LRILFNLHNAKFVIDSSSTTPLFIDKINLNILNNSQRTIVYKSAKEGSYSNTVLNSNAKIFMEDWVSEFIPAFPVKLWARHLNSEVQPEGLQNLYNNGGQFWVLGYKTEGRANLAKTINGGSTEILGSLVYPASSFSGNNQEAFVTENANMSVTGLTMTSYIGNGWYGIAAREKQGMNEDTLMANTIWSTTPYNFSFYKTGTPANIAASAQSGDLIFKQNDMGFVLKNVQNSRYKITVNNSGQLITSPTNTSTSNSLIGGELNLGLNSVYMKDANGNYWRISVTSTGQLISIPASSLPTNKIEIVSNNLEITSNSKGLIFKNGENCWKIYVDDNGVVKTVKVLCP